MTNFLIKIYILFLQQRDFVDIDSILDAVTGYDSDCDVLSSGDEFDDDDEEEDWELDVVDDNIGGGDEDEDVGNVSGDGSDDSDDDDNVPLASRKKSKLIISMKATTICAKSCTPIYS